MNTNKKRPRGTARLMPQGSVIVSPLSSGVDIAGNPLAEQSKGNACMQLAVKVASPKGFTRCAAVMAYLHAVGIIADQGLPNLARPSQPQPGLMSICTVPKRR